jgi:ketosteroid isomerase-like protein
MSPSAQSDPMAVIRAWVHAVNKHDLEAVAAIFATNYHDVEPVHPTRRITGGRENVRKNYGMVFDGIPDLRVEVLRVAEDGDTTWSEVDWSGTRRDGSREHQRGVHIFGVRNGQIAWGRIYLETVEEDGIDLDERVRRMAKGTSSKEAPTLPSPKGGGN